MEVCSKIGAWSKQALSSQPVACLVQVYNVRQAKTDIDAVYSMGLFDDVTILPQPSDDSTPDQPKASSLPAALSRVPGGISEHAVKA